MSVSKHPVWLITGCSTGFGRELARLVIDRGWNVVVTARDRARVADLAQGAEDRVLALGLDITKSEQIREVVKSAEQQFGHIDVLVNNAGYGYQSSIEEADDTQVRAQFDANVFGLFEITRMVLPGMRARRQGHIINISSVAGFIGFAGSGYYAATKHAVEGFSTALAAEVEPLGLRVTSVSPGPFRTDWAGRSLQQTVTELDDYRDTVGERMSRTAQASGQQPGDPIRAAQAMIDIYEHEQPPHHLVLGAWGVDQVSTHLRQTLDEIEKWRDTSINTDYPTDETG